MSPPPSSTRSKQSVLDLLASYSNTKDDPLARFAEARLERQQSRAARLQQQQLQQQGASSAPATVEAPAIVVDAIEDPASVVVPEDEDGVAEGAPRLRVKPPTSAGGRTYSPTIPGTPYASPETSTLEEQVECHSPAPSLAGDLASSPQLARAPSTASASNVATRNSIDIAEIPAYKGPPSRPTSPLSAVGERDTPPKPANASAQDVKSRLKEKLKQQHDKAESVRSSTSASAVPASPVPTPLHVETVRTLATSTRAEPAPATDLPASPALVPIPFAAPEPSPSAAQPTLNQAKSPSTPSDLIVGVASFDKVDWNNPLLAGLEKEANARAAKADDGRSETHQWHAMSPITERTERSSMFTHHTGSVNQPQSSAFSLRSSLHSSAISSIKTPSAFHAPTSLVSSSSRLDSQQRTARASASSSATPTRATNTSPTRKPSPELARRAALFTGAAPLSAESATSIKSPSVYSTASGSVAGDVFRRSYETALSAPRAPTPQPTPPPPPPQPVAVAVAAPATATVPPLSPDESRYVPAGWAALRQEREEELAQYARPAPQPTSSLLANPAPSIIYSDRLQSDAGVEPLPLTPDDPKSPSGAIIYEGTLLVPPPGPSSASTAWGAQYCVLTASTLEARPTDRSSQRQAVVMLYIGDCLSVQSFDEPIPGRPVMRGFEVRAVGGVRKVFGAEGRVARRNWVLALEKVIPNSNKTQITRSPWTMEVPKRASITSAGRSPRKLAAEEGGRRAASEQEPSKAGSHEAHSRAGSTPVEQLNETEFFASPSALSSDPNNAPVMVSRPFPLGPESTTRFLAHEQSAPALFQPPQPASHHKMPQQDMSSEQDASAFRAMNSGPYSLAEQRHAPAPAPPVRGGGVAHSTKTGRTADESSLFGGVLPADVPPTKISDPPHTDLFGYLQQQQSNRAPLPPRPAAPPSEVSSVASPRKALPQLPPGAPRPRSERSVPSAHVHWNSQLSPVQTRRHPLSMMDHSTPRHPVPAHIAADLAAVGEVIAAALADEERVKRPHTVATDIFFLLKSVLTKLKLEPAKSGMSSMTLNWVERLLLPLVERLVPSHATAAREHTALHLALVETLDVVHHILAHHRQHQQPSTLPPSPLPNTRSRPRPDAVPSPFSAPLLSPSRALDPDQATQTTRGMVHNEDEARSWQEQRASYTDEAAQAQSQILFRDSQPPLESTPSPLRHRRREVRATERTLMGHEDPYGPSTATNSVVSDSSSAAPRRRQPPKTPRKRRGPFGQVVDDDDDEVEGEEGMTEVSQAPSEASSSGRTARAAAQQQRAPPPAPPSTRAGQRPISEAQRIAQSQGWNRVAPSERSQRVEGWEGTGSAWKAAGSARGVGPESVARGGKVGEMPQEGMDGVLYEIKRTLQEQQKMMNENESHRKQLAELLNWMSDAMVMSANKQDQHFSHFAQQATDLQTYLAHKFPAVLAAALSGQPIDNFDSAAYGEGQDTEQQEPTTDRTEGGAVDGAEAEGEAGPGAGGAASGAGRVKLGGFACLEDGLQGKLKRAVSRGGGGPGRAGGVKGPRGLRIWGAPPGTTRTSHWASAVPASSAPPAKLADQTDEEYDKMVAAHISAAEKRAHQPLIEAIRTDEGLAQTLEVLAAGAGGEGGEAIDAGTMALAVFEILQSMREIHRKQAQKEAQEAEDRMKHGGLSKHEVALLELKKAELAKLEQLTQAENTTTTKLDKLVAEFNRKDEAFNASLTRIEQEIKAPGKGEMDPELVAEGKRLLEGVKAGVDGHVKDFRGQITGEVQRMFKEVGKLRDEKKNLQAQIGELMAFHARQGGGAGAGGAPAAPAPAATPAPDAGAKPGMAPSGWFGPRAPK